MFKTDLVTDGATALPARRWHRALTIPALVITFAALVISRYCWAAVLLFPPVVAMPWLAAAASRPTARAIEAAHQAVRGIGHIMCALAFVLLFWGLSGGLDGGALALAAIEGAAATAVLLAAGKRASEPRLAIAVMMIAVLQLFAMLPLLWLRVSTLTMFPAAIAMFTGGVWWLLEAQTQPVVETRLPVAIAL